eukprot:4438465-Pleurochrysis_carterae.AAC.1
MSRSLPSERRCCLWICQRPSVRSMMPCGAKAGSSSCACVRIRASRVCCRARAPRPTPWRTCSA